MSIVIITGASKGIGRATAIMLSDQGHEVFNLSRTPLEHAGVTNVLIDLAADDAEQRVAAFTETIAAGKIHLVHNAARLISDQVTTIETSGFREVININLIAPQILNHALLPKMKAGSSVIYVGSTLSEKAVANSYSYVITKHAMVGMMRATCQDLAGTEIHTACICPGFTDTEMLRAHVGESQDILDSIAAGSTQGRLIAPEEIAETICFATTHPVLNGAVIHANLGQIEQ